jgi:hypothetical protein
MIEYHDGTQWRPYHKDDILDKVIGMITADFRNFIENLDFKDSNENYLMSSVEESLDWDLYCDKYEYDDDAKEFDLGSKENAKKEALKNRIYTLFYEHIQLSQTTRTLNHKLVK